MVLWRVHHAVVLLERVDRVDQSALRVDDGLATLEGLLVWELHDALPKCVHLHSLVGILELLDELEDKSLLLKVSLYTVGGGLEELGHLLIMVNLESLRGRLGVLISGRLVRGATSAYP